jgi:hypothetical protein
MLSNSIVGLLSVEDIPQYIVLGYEGLPGLFLQENKVINPLKKGSVRIPSCYFDRRSQPPGI